MQKNFVRFVLVISCFVLLATFGLTHIRTMVMAEQVGSSPESGATSKIKTIYDSLVSLGHGTDAAGSWGNWGVMWNRIRSAAEWTPNGTATEADVADGLTFYSGDRTQKIGTANLAPDWSTFSQQILEDAATGDSTTEEAVWTNTAGTSTTGVWKDTRTGLYWSAVIGSYDWATAQSTCLALSIDSDGDATLETDWYLPTQKELLMAYIDGIYNQTNTTFATQQSAWSNTTSTINNSYADTVELSQGAANVYVSKVSMVNTRCVRRD